MSPVTRYLNYFLYEYLDIPRPKPKPEPAPEPKRFGLEQAEAAAQYVSTPEAAKPVMAVVVGILGYQNTIAEDVKVLASLTGERNDQLGEEIEANEARITAFEAKIDDIRRENERLMRYTVDNGRRLGKAHNVADMFTA